MGKPAARSRAARRRPRRDPPPPGGGGGARIPAPAGRACETGQVSCGPGGQVAANACAAGTYCVTGCCRPVVID